MNITQCVYRVTEKDNVATALSDLEPGQVKVHGAGDISSAACLEPVMNGHKIALVPIRAGEPVVKYGVVIGQATADIAPGTWVHLHNMKSLYDERSSTLDLYTGAPTDTQYI